MSFTMSRAEREAFLADLHVGILSVAQDGQGPLTVPVWYAYEPGGDLRFITGRTSRKMSLLQQAGRFSLCAQDEAPPYKYVTVEGPISSIDPVDLEQDYRLIARRYLGIQGGDDYIAQNGGATAGADSVIVRMRPEHWLSVDYGK